MKAFRNTGIEGGYVSLATQNWLLARRREDQRYSRVTGEKTSHFHRTGKGYGPPVKTAPIKGVNILYVPYLISYVDGPFEPSKYGASAANRHLLKKGLIQGVVEPRFVSSNGQAFGDLYLPTKLGVEYVKFLRDGPRKGEV